MRRSAGISGPSQAGKEVKSERVEIVGIVIGTIILTIGAVLSSKLWDASKPLTKFEQAVHTATTYVLVVIWCLTLAAIIRFISISRERKRNCELLRTLMACCDDNGWYSPRTSGERERCYILVREGFCELDEKSQRVRISEQAKQAHPILAWRRSSEDDANEKTR